MYSFGCTVHIRHIHIHNIHTENRARVHSVSRIVEYDNMRWIEIPQAHKHNGEGLSFV